MYVDSTKEAVVSGGGSTVLGPFELHDNAPDQMERLFVNHIKIGVKNNEQAFNDVKIRPSEYPEEAFGARSEEERSGLHTLQIWTNDQPANISHKV